MIVNISAKKKPVRRKIRTKAEQFSKYRGMEEKEPGDQRERDRYLCQICIRKLYGTTQQYNNREIEVHHIVPIAKTGTEGWTMTILFHYVVGIMRWPKSGEDIAGGTERDCQAAGG